jgi:3-deoxy-D-manno-octulosonic-acid transferase
MRIGADADAVGAHVEALLADVEARTAMTTAACELVKRGRGALQRTLDAILLDLP